MNQTNDPLRESLDDVVASARQAYEFSPGSYTATAFQIALQAREQLDRIDAAAEG